MKKKVNIEEGLQSLERILLMMNYDSKKTLSENRNLLSEQSTLEITGPYFSKDNQLIPSDYKVQRAFNTKKQFEPIYLKIVNKFSEPIAITDVKFESDFKLTLVNYSKSPIKPNLEGRINFNLGYVKNCSDTIGRTDREINITTTKGNFKKNLKFDYDNEISEKEKKDCEGTMHDIVQSGALLTGIGGFAFPPLLAISLGLEVLDGYLYLQENDPYMAGLSWALSILPGSELLPKGFLKTPVKKLISEIIPVLKNAGKWSDDIFKKLSPDASKLLKWVIDNIESIFKVGKTTFKNTDNVLKFITNKADIPVYLSKIFKTLKNTGKFVGDITLKGIIPAGGIMISYDYLYNELSKLSNEELEQEMNQGLKNTLNKGQKYFEELKKRKEKEKKQSSEKVDVEKKQFQWKPSPSLDKVEKGVASIFMGMSGDSVANVQNLLNQKGANLTVDSKFGRKTKSAVIDFQTTNQLNKIDGIVGKETYKKLTQ